nr:MAG TPA: hypothetical protein [Caudoviricetes sp.]
MITHKSYLREVIRNSRFLHSRPSNHPTETRTR